MNYNNISFLLSVFNIEQLPKKLPEIVFAGRSNVGKSSMINKLLGRKNFARVSAKPGKTASINYYNIDNTIYFTDLPGYGYAKVSKNKKFEWGELIESYFVSDRDIRLMIFLVDIRHEPSELDKDMALWLNSSNYNFIVCAAKSDKLSKTQVKNRTIELKSQLSLTEDIPVIPFSAVSGEGRDEILNLIEKYAGDGLKEA